MNKICTSIEQSKKLVKILPLESADMAYVKKRYGTSFYNVPLFHYEIKVQYPKYTNMDFCIPAWSLAALISVLPDTITSNDGIAFKLNIKKNIIEYSNPSLYLIYKSVKADNLVDVCYEMIIKLHKKNLLLLWK